MKKVLLSCVLSGVFFIANQVSAATSAENAATASASLQVGSVTIQEVEPTAAELLDLNHPFVLDNLQLPLQSGGLGFDINDIITIGEKIYEIVKANQPVVTIKRALVSVVPGGANDWTQLQGWQAPMTKVLEVTIKNLYGITTVSMRLKVSANYGGNADGVGHYLANVNMVPTQVYAAWGYSVDVAVATANAVNSGSKADPIAGLGLELSYHVHTLLSDVTGAQDYWLTGKGELRVMQ